MTDSIAKELKLVSEILGETPEPFQIAKTHHPITKWEWGGRTLITKNFQNRRSYEVELRVYEAFSEHGATCLPKLLGKSETVLALEYVEAKQLVDSVDPFDFDGDSPLFIEFAKCMADFHRLGASMALEEFPDMRNAAIPGPQGFVHGDALPHNVGRADTRIYFFDFERCGRGHCYLDLAPLACVLNQELRKAFHDTYRNERKVEKAQCAFSDFEEVCRQWPRLFLKAFSPAKCKNCSSTRQVGEKN